MTSPELLAQNWDIIVVGTGAAGLTAALAALTTPSPSPSPSAPRVLIIDKAPAEWMGGNGYFTAAAYRVQHNGLEDIRPLVSNIGAELNGRIELPMYPAEAFHEDLQRVTGGRSSAVLGDVVVRESLALVKWLKDVGGVEWWMSFDRQAYEVDGRWVFWGGLCLTVPEGGKGLVRVLMEAVKKYGGHVLFDTAARDIILDQETSAVKGLKVENGGNTFDVKVGSVIMCAGGFEASPEMRKKYLGPGWELAHTRGTPYNTGDMFLASVALGAKVQGDFSPGGCHSTCWDANSPKEGGDRIKTNEFTKSGYPLGLMLNVEGKRFVDEGVDMRNYTYAKFGRAILEQPKGLAFQVWDADGQSWLRKEEYRDEIVRKITAETIEELAQKCLDEGLENAEQFEQTIKEYNAAVAAHRQEHPEVSLNPAIKDGLSTQSSTISLALAKSNWAIPIVKPPFLAVKVTSGITFTFGGLAIDPTTATVLREDGGEITGLHCAGEMVGGLFYGNYPGGSGLTAGGVFGRRAGQAAAARTNGRSTVG
ncbi:putative succinate dehydrogenase/fumarate reductase flavoprotein, catalytic domain superfamily [Acrodontium crateriforme]|uniref:Succinate dehydrogenase/fumarate reductase flavoprotein, catalytic domain superfamily n=1 Tax=Acrodontium crateriforme TaxID=150365 RepID=A0AAQ3M6S8_9PEZI|nr:putative succinate dehydrogenase/fumarate reductase flavoprotein, catalytic domain superfamily [Acrodontium crateriforme]